MCAYWCWDWSFNLIPPSQIFIQKVLISLRFRNCLLFVDALAILFGLLIYIQNPAMLFFCRFVQGICVGFYSAIAPLIIKEFAPTEIAGTLGTFSQLFVAFGVFFACLEQVVFKSIFKKEGQLDVETEEHYWKFMFGFTLITTSIQTILLLFVYKFETPKYLLEKGR